MTLVIFDVDGTLIDGENWASKRDLRENYEDVQRIVNSFDCGHNGVTLSKATAACDPQKKGAPGEAPLG